MGGFFTLRVGGELLVGEVCERVVITIIESMQNLVVKILLWPNT